MVFFLNRKRNIHLAEYNMKKIAYVVLTMVLLPMALKAQNPYAYFTYVCPSGQTLWYSIDANGRGASVTWPHHVDGNFYYGHTKPSGRVVIPDTVRWTYEGTTHVYPVYGVLQNCFNGCTGITTVVFPETVTAFEPNAFAGCTSLDSIIMPTVPPVIYAGQPIGMSDSANFYIPCGTWQAYYEARYYTLHNGGMGHPLCLEPAAEGVSLTLLSDNSEMGVAEFYTPGVIDWVRCDSVAMIYATPMEHYAFDHWSNGSTKVADTLYITSDSVITAYFVVGHHSVEVSSQNEERGTVKGSGSYPYLDTIEIKAIPNPGYHFDHWNDGNTDNPRTLVVDRDYRFMAFFAEGDPTGIRDAVSSDIRIHVADGRIVVEGADGKEVKVFAVDGKQVPNVNLIPGAYMVKVGNLPIRKVVVTK